MDMRCGDCGAVRSCSHDDADHTEAHADDCGVHRAYETARDAKTLRDFALGRRVLYVTPNGRARVIASAVGFVVQVWDDDDERWQSVETSTATYRARMIADAYAERDR